ncbi:MAG TPA: response regulator, partial [Candidatus Aminicenantes bacterium]|nr:response regulator [Candidatus Aminicenantes bacterium]
MHGFPGPFNESNHLFHIQGFVDYPVGSFPKRLLNHIFNRKGYAVTTAKDGPEAIERVKEGPFDLIFLDIKLPFMNGVEAYRRIKKIRPESVVVMMTAYAVEDMVQEALREGAYGIIYKPLDMEKVIALIERAREAM